MHWILKKNPANKMLFIRTEYFEKISGHIQVGLRIGVFSGQIKPEVVQTEYLKSEYPYRPHGQSKTSAVAVAVV